MTEVAAATIARTRAVQDESLLDQADPGTLEAQVWNLEQRSALRGLLNRFTYYSDGKQRRFGEL